MKNFLTFVVISFVSAALFCGCKEKKTTGSDFLQHLVEEINNQADKTFQMEQSWTVVNTNKATAYLFFM